jgi:excisionase family DNA binding protein
MAQNLLSLEEAAAMLGISTDELNRLREDREIFGVRDGATWKFKREEVERYRDMNASSSAIGGSISDLPITLDDDDSREGDSVLLSNIMLEGPSSSMSSTVIGKAGDLDDGDVDIQLGGEDIQLGGEVSDLQLAGDSGLSLIPTDGGGMDSDLKLVADEPQSGAADEATVQYQASGDSDLELAADDDLSFSGIGLAEDSSPKQPKVAPPEGESDIALGGSNLALEDDEFTLSDSTIGGGLVEEGSPESTINLVEDDDAGDLVLGGSGIGSDIADSGINLAAAADSGLSLEEPLGELGSDQALGAVQELEEVSDDEFLLTPMLEVEGDEADASGSQVIALDADEPFDENAATLLGEDIQGMEMLGAAPAFGAGPQPAMGGPLAAPMPTMAPAMAEPEGKYGLGSILGLTAVSLVLAVSGIMMYEMLIYMWSWENPSPIVGNISKSLVNLFEQ